MQAPLMRDGGVPNTQCAISSCRSGVLHTKTNNIKIKYIRLIIVNKLNKFRYV